MTNGRSARMVVLVLLSLIALLAVSQATRSGRRAAREAWRSVRAAANVVHPQPVVILRIWNIRRGTAVRVELFESGRLIVAARANTERQLPIDRMQQLIEAATAALADISADGCETGADGLNASLYVMIDRRWHGATCRNASGWPKGADTRRLLKEINDQAGFEVHHGAE